MGEQWILREEPDRLLDGFPEPLREALAGWDSARIVDWLDRHQGQNIYLPRTEHLTRQLKCERIKQEFTGQNHRELARKFGISLTQVYRILAEANRPGSEQTAMDGF